MKVTVDLSKPAGERVSAVKVGSGELDVAATYKLATNDYMANGGDGYTVLKSAKVLLGAN